MNKTLRLGLTLLVISVVAASILAFSNDATKEKIAEIELQMTQDALSGIFGEIENYEPIEGSDFEKMQEEDPEIIEVYKILESDDVKGYSITTASNGFDGPIEIMVGVDSEGDILGVRLLKHTETAGIGSKAAEPEFTEKFEGKETSEEIEVETISGATTTSVAVIKGVNKARETYVNFLAN